MEGWEWKLVPSFHHLLLAAEAPSPLAVEAKSLEGGVVAGCEFHPWRQLSQEPNLGNKTWYISMHRLHTPWRGTWALSEVLWKPFHRGVYSQPEPRWRPGWGGSREPCLLGTRPPGICFPGVEGLSALLHRKRTQPSLCWWGPPKASVIGQTVRLNYTYCVGAPSACADGKDLWTSKSPLNNHLLFCREVLSLLVWALTMGTIEEFSPLYCFEALGGWFIQGPWVAAICHQWGGGEVWGTGVGNSNFPS